MGGACVATASLPIEIRISAPWPPTAGNRSGAKIRSMSFSDRPLTRASAPPVRSCKACSVAANPGGTQTSRGVRARSRSVPSISSSMAQPPRHFESFSAINASEEPSAGHASSRGGSTRFARPSVITSLHSSQRLRDRFQCAPLRRDRIAPANGRGHQHQRRAKQIAGKNTAPRTGVDQRPKQDGTGDAAHAGTNGIEQGNRQRTHLQWKVLTDRQISSTCGRRSKEENDHPGDRLRLRTQCPDLKQVTRERKQNSGSAVSKRDHRAAPQRIEQPAENQRSQQISGRERKDIPAKLVGRYPVEIAQYERKGEKDGVVEERLGCHQHQSNQRAFAINLKQRVYDFRQRRMVPHTDL